jgi:hypothetical protein
MCERWSAVSVGACRTLVMLLARALLATGLQPRSADQPPARGSSRDRGPRADCSLTPRAAPEQASSTLEERVRRHEDS